MGVFVVRIETDTFGVNTGEIARILYNVAEEVHEGVTTGACFDVNGVNVGGYEIEGMEE